MFKIYILSSKRLASISLHKYIRNSAKLEINIFLHTYIHIYHKLIIVYFTFIFLMYFQNPFREKE